MRQSDRNRVVFHSQTDMSAPIHLKKAELVLQATYVNENLDVNDYLERYNICKYFEQDLYLSDWSFEEKNHFKNRVEGFKKQIGKFFSKVHNENFNGIYAVVIHQYVDSFWEIITNHRVFKRISEDKIKEVLDTEPYLINVLLKLRPLVRYYDSTFRNFLMAYEKSAEILLSIYEVKTEFSQTRSYLPDSLSLKDKEQIVTKYMNSDDCNLNFLGLIPDARRRDNFRPSPKTRLRAKQVYKKKLDELFDRNSGIPLGVTVEFSNDMSNIVDSSVDNKNILHLKYSRRYIIDNPEVYRLFQNFKYLFDFVDEQNRINLISKKSQLGTTERLLGFRSRSEYIGGTLFMLAQISSQGQIAGYWKVLSSVGLSIEGVLHKVFTSEFQARYSFPDNARLFLPKEKFSSYEKIKLIAPEFESCLKQFKIFVENNEIDFDLLAISSSPVSIRDIPSLNQGKYIYLNDKHRDVQSYTHLFFSDQTLLAYVEPHKKKHYKSFFDLLANEEICYENYERHNKPQIDYLIKEGFLFLDKKRNVQMKNFLRIMILKDLYENETGSYHHYPENFQKEARLMQSENLLYFENSLFSKSEQSYFNYHLNKSEFSNGLDLRNSYLHGTHGKQEDDESHFTAYLSYLKLMVLALLKMDEDLWLFKQKFK